MLRPKILLVLMVLLLLPVLTGAQTNSATLYPRCAPFGCEFDAPVLIISGGTTVFTINGTAVTSTVPILIPDGVNSAPGLAFSADTDIGIFRSAASVVFSINSVTAARVTATTLDHFSNAADIRLGSANDLHLAREGAASLQLGEDAATATAQTVSAADSTGAGITGGTLYLSGGAGGAAGAGGPVAIVDSGTKPTCAAGIRGAIWYDAGAGGVADTFEVCRKDAADAYAWAALF